MSLLVDWLGMVQSIWYPTVLHKYIGRNGWKIQFFVKYKTVNNDPQ